MRPDEKSAEARISRAKNFESAVKNTAFGFGSAALGANLTSKLLPLLNEFIPTDLAVKGISKISPKIGEFIRKGQSMGLDVKEGLNFLKSKMQPEEKSEKKSPLDFLSGYSPELARFIKDHVDNGRTPQEAAAIARLPGKFDKDVKSIEKDTKENFVDLIARLFGHPVQKQQDSGQQAAQNQQGNPQGLDPQLMQLMQGIRSSIQNLKGK